MLVLRPDQIMHAHRLRTTERIGSGGEGMLQIGAVYRGIMHKIVNRRSKSSATRLQSKH